MCQVAHAAQAAPRHSRAQLSWSTAAEQEGKGDSVCMCVCLRVYLSVCLSICLSVCLSVCLSSLVCLFRLFACLLWHLGRTSLLRWKSNTRYSGVPLSGSCTAVEISNRTARSQMS